MKIIYKLKKLFQHLFKIHKKKINSKMIFEKINFLISEIETIKDEKNLFLLEYAIISLENDNEQVFYLLKKKIKKNKNISIEMEHNENISSIILKYNLGGSYGCKRVS